VFKNNKILEMSNVVWFENKYENNDDLGEVIDEDWLENGRYEDELRQFEGKLDRGFTITERKSSSGKIYGLLYSEHSIDECFLYAIGPEHYIKNLYDRIVKMS
jgi:hypothetical protein